MAHTSARRWRGDYAKLEYKHGFIQWLYAPQCFVLCSRSAITFVASTSFPIPELGANYESQPLQRHEAEAMKADETIVERVLRSYRLMLDFYGMSLEDSETGLLARSDKNYKDRYRNLTRESHATSTHEHGTLETTW